MHRTEHLLIKAQEEAAELIQRLAKAAVYGMEQIQQPHETTGTVTDVSTNPEGLTNRERIHKEYLDLIAVMMMLSDDAVDIDYMSEADQDHINRKWSKVEKYLKHPPT